MHPKTIGAGVFMLLTACAGRSPSPGVASPSEQSNASAANTQAHQHQHRQHATMQHDKQAMQRMHEQHCPLKVEGTKVTAADVEGAAALDFETTTDVAELQRRVARMAEHHAGEGCAMASHAGGMAAAGEHPPGHGAQHLAAPAPSANAGAQGSAPPAAPVHAANEHQLMHSATVTAENTERGARLVFTPKQPEHLEGLRAAVRSKAERMSAGACAMHSCHAH